MIVLETGSLEISDVKFDCNKDNENDKIVYPILFKSENKIENLVFNNDTSTYSPLLYITTPNGISNLEFNNLTFTDCKCTNNYVIEVFECSDIKFSQTNIIFNNIEESSGGIKIDQSDQITIEDSNFKQRIYSIELTETTPSINRCFDLSASSSVSFIRNTIENMSLIGKGNVYIGKIKSNSYDTLYLREVVFDEITFINNICDTLFGGGSSLLILSEKVVFNKCKFINNRAIQMTNSDLEQRPQPDGIEGIYYNGDGGGLQFGYSESTSNADLDFIA